ncbi:MAG: diphthine--ammonia ligase [Cytophagales bacterium]|nr:diphthine--ammonia ligase [Cytophagales bacterium]
MQKEKAIFNWSGGKDSALCLYKILRSNEYEISWLLTTVSEKYQRISQHGVRVELLEQQAENIGIPLEVLMMPDSPTMEAYNCMMEKTLKGFKKQGVHLSIFGDIFLEDLRKYREERLATLDLVGVFPLWKLNTRKLVDEFIDLGFKAIVVCVDSKDLDRSFVGREIDEKFINDLPEKVDPCGEYGEFHTFVYDGPVFQKPVKFTKGEIVYRKYTPPKKTEDSSHAGTCNPYTSRRHENLTHPEFGFWYCDLL